LRVALGPITRAFFSNRGTRQKNAQQDRQTPRMNLVIKKFTYTFSQQKKIIIEKRFNIESLQKIIVVKKPLSLARSVKLAEQEKLSHLQQTPRQSGQS
jgi:hypothetical protein